LHRWLYAHPHLGKSLIDWEQQGAISRTSKVVAVLMLIASWFVMYHQLTNVLVLTGIGVLFIVITSFLVTRPEPDKGK